MIHTSQTCDVILHLFLQPSGRILLLVEVIAVNFEQLVRRLVRLAEVLQQLGVGSDGQEQTGENNKKQISHMITEIPCSATAAAAV